MRVGILRSVVKRAVDGGYVSRDIWGKLPVEVDFPVHFPGQIRFRYQSSAYDGIGRQLFWAGEEHWEYETIEIFCRLALRARRVLDIGANTGIYTLISCAAHPDTRVTAFEPVPRIREQLSRNISLNGYENRCEVLNHAVSDENGTARFHVPDSVLPTTASLHADGFRGAAGEHIEVPLSAIDSLLDADDAVDLIKIDVEGFEDHALRGMMNLLKTHEPAVVLECNHDGPVSALEEIVSTLGFGLYHLLPTGPVPVKSFSRDAADKHRNYLLLPSSKAGWIL